MADHLGPCDSGSDMHGRAKQPPTTSLHPPDTEKPGISERDLRYVGQDWELPSGRD